MIADAVAAAESASGQGELPAAELLPSPSESVGLIGHMSQEKMQAQALAYNHALQWSSIQKPEALVHPAPVALPPVASILTVSEIKAAFKQAYSEEIKAFKADIEADI
jgi:hypothetical protein